MILAPFWLKPEGLLLAAYSHTGSQLCGLLLTIIFIYIYIYIYESFHARSTSKNRSCPSNPELFVVWVVLYNVTLHAKYQVPSVFSFRDI